MILLTQPAYLEAARNTLDFDGTAVPAHDCNDRVARIAAGLADLPGLRREICAAPTAADDADIERALGAIHDPDYLAFLRRITTDIADEMLEHPYVCPYSAPESFLSAASWPSAYASAAATHAGVRRLLADDDPVYVINRPPGHHAGRAYMGGFCYLNNAALAANLIHRATGETVGILDVDIHYGNGTAEITRHSRALAYASIHGDRCATYPFYVAPEDDASAAIHTVDFAADPGIAAYLVAVEASLKFLLEERRAACLLVSVGYDAAVDDPLGGWRFRPADFRAIGARIADAAPARLLVLQEGGYNVDLLPACARNFVEGLVARRA